ncbi:GNAT family N-acetyltransferase [Halobacteriales archaeon QS_1_68_17]|nr:MAG: GNAT family N-acetyltransferase [Halobacteriales archaeon QS_1_68_17]
MEYAVVGWPADGPRLDLDHERFAYAGKFATGRTGKAVARNDGGVVAAASFNEDRAAAGALRIRYVTVREDRRGEGIGPRLVAFLADRARARGYERVRISVNNAFSFESLSKAGFAYTGEQTGLAELVMEWPAERTRASYQAGLDAFRERDLSSAEASFLAAREGTDPPTVVDASDTSPES